VSKNIFNFRISYIFLPSPLTISTEANSNISNEVRPPIEPIGDLTGATIRITSNKFKGLTGIITERRTYQHAFIECDQQQQLIDPVHISDIEIITHPPKSLESTKVSTAAIDVPVKEKKKMDLESSQQIMAREIMAVKEKYIGALVRIVNHHKDKDVVGIVKKIIYGDYYITDNPDIKGAVRKGYEVLKYPPGFNDVRGKEEEKLKEDATDDNDEKMDDAKSDEKASENLVEVEKDEVNKKPSSTNPSGEDAKSSENDEEVVEEEVNIMKPSSTDAGEDEDAKANDKKDKEEEEEDSNIIQAETPAAAAASSTTSSQVMPNRKQNLIGATIRIKKGRYAGLVGVINERQNIRRIQLDSLPLPVKFDDIEGKLTY